MTDWLADRLIDWQASGPIDWLIDWLTDGFDWRIDRPFCYEEGLTLETRAKIILHGTSLTDWLTDWLSDRSTDKLTDWLANWLAGWLAG